MINVFFCGKSVLFCWQLGALQTQNPSEILGLRCYKSAIIRHRLQVSAGLWLGDRILAAFSAAGTSLAPHFSSLSSTNFFGWFQPNLPILSGLRFQLGSLHFAWPQGLAGVTRQHLLQLEFSWYRTLSLFLIISLPFLTTLPCL